MVCYLVGARTKDNEIGSEMLPFFVYKNKFLKIVNKFGGFGKILYICGVKEEVFP